MSQILENLNADEWRHVRAVANHYPLQYDIIAALPLELVAHVFSFLEVADVFQYRQVSVDPRLSCTSGTSEWHAHTH